MFCNGNCKTEETKLRQVKDDIANLNEIFQHIDRTSKRISSAIQKDYKEFLEKQKKSKSKSLEKVAAEHGNCMDDSSVMEECGSVRSEISLHWEDYEKMNDLERAQLLERAITVLAEDRGAKNYAAVSKPTRISKR